MSKGSHSHERSYLTWIELARPEVKRRVIVALAVLASGTVAGLFALWPSSSGMETAATQAAEIGLGSERIVATVSSATDDPCPWGIGEDPQICRLIKVIPESGSHAGIEIDLPGLNLEVGGKAPEVELGDSIIVGYEPLTDFYFYADKDRRAPMLALAVLFAAVVVGLGRFRGLLALGAMAMTVVTLVGFLAPSILDGNDPLAVSVVSASLIAFVSLYLTHGFNPTSSIALIGTLAALALTLVISWGFFHLAGFTGLATEEGLVLPFLSVDLNLGSLLLGGAILGALGALDDVTVTQAAMVSELRKSNPELGFGALFASGIRVGREHIGATVNTLLLAYAGASMPLLLLLAVSGQEFSMIANSELVAVEVFRTLSGSLGLIAAAPITTWLAATLLSTNACPSSDEQGGVGVDAPSGSSSESPNPAEWEDFSPRSDVWGA